VIWFLRLDILLGEKNFVRKALVSSSHVVMHSEGKKLSHALALSPSKKGNSCNQITSLETPLSFNVLHTSKNTERCKLGSSKGFLPNWDCWTMEIRANMSSKLCGSTFGQAMLEAMPWTPEVTKF